MMGGLTYKALDAMKLKAKALDAIREYLRSPDCDQSLLVVQEMLAAAYPEESQ